MRKIVALLLALTMLLCVGCAKTDGIADTNDAVDTISTDGSTSMEKLMEIYKEVYPEMADVKLNYNPTGSTAGIQAVQEGRCDVGLSSRDLKDDEAAALTSTVCAIDGIAVVVHPENPVVDLTLEQIGKLYRGEIANWSEVGGADAPVVCIGRENGSGTRDGFESITGTEDTCVYSQELSSTGDIITTVSSNPNAIGYASLSAVSDKVKAVTVEGVAASEATVQDGSYAIQRNFVMVTPKDGVNETVQSFLDWATSAEADTFVREAGAVPVKH